MTVFCGSISKAISYVLAETELSMVRQSCIRTSEPRSHLALKNIHHKRPITWRFVTGGKGGIEEGDHHTGCALSQDTLPQMDPERTNYSECILNPNNWRNLYPKYCQFALPPSLFAPAFWGRKQYKTRVSEKSFGHHQNLRVVRSFNDDCHSNEANAPLSKCPPTDHLLART